MKRGWIKVADSVLLPVLPYDADKVSRSALPNAFVRVHDVS